MQASSQQVAPVLELGRVRPSRDVFLRIFAEHLRERGRRPELITAHRSAVSWFLSSLARPPHEATPEAFARFLEEARAMGAQPPRIAALKTAVAAAFDQMCLHPITEGPTAPVTAPMRVRPVPSPAAPPERVTRKVVRAQVPLDPAASGALLEALHKKVGLTAPELAALTWGDVDLAAEIVTVATRAEGERHVPLTGRAAQLLHRAQPQPADRTRRLFAGDDPGAVALRIVEVLLQQEPPPGPMVQAPLPFASASGEV